MLPVLDRRIYLEVVNEVASCCSQPVLDDGIVSVFLAGSVARGDFSPGRSDIDIYVVHDGLPDSVQRDLLLRIRHVSEDKVPSLFALHTDPITFAFSTIQELKAGVSFGSGCEYHPFILTAKLLCGSETRGHIPVPTRIAERTSARNALGAGAAQFASMAAQIPPERLPAIISGAFSTVFRTASIALCGDGTYASGKRDIALAFPTVYPTAPHLSALLRESLLLWERWSQADLDDDEYRRLCNITLEFIPGLYHLYEIPFPG